MAARLTRPLMGLSWSTSYTLTPFRLDGGEPPDRRRGDLRLDGQAAGP